MTTYAYVAMDPAGRKNSGTVVAQDRDAAIAAVAGGGVYVLQIEERAAEKSANGHSGKGRIGKGDVALFTRRMADLAEAGLPLDRVLQVVAEQSESPRLSAIAEEALVEVRGGLPVSEALAQHPKIFPTVYTQTLRAGEASGQFAQVASRLADFQEMEVARRSQVASAMVYPAVLTGTAVFVVVFLIAFVVPRLSGVFTDLGGELPAMTKLLLAITSAVTNYGLLWLAVIVGLFVLYRGWVATDAGATARDALIFKIPKVGPVIRKAVVSRFARVLGTLVFGGVPILDSIKLAGLAAGNRVFRNGAESVEQQVREGKPIAEAMRDAGGFPPVLTHMVAIGEETGDLPKMLGRVSDSLDFEVDTGLKRLTSLVEPLIVLSMAFFVGFVVLAVVLPIFQAQDLVK